MSQPNIIKILVIIVLNFFIGCSTPIVNESYEEELVEDIKKVEEEDEIEELDGEDLKTIIFHCDSGESISSTAKIPQNVILKGMNAFQVLGSANTYIRRYALSSALGLVTDKDIDACGEQLKEPIKTPSDKLKDCKTLKDLASVYTSLTRTEQTASVKLKDELKLTLK